MFTREYLKLASAQLLVDYRLHYARRETSGEGVGLIAQHLTAMQDKRWKLVPLHDENTARFFHTETAFRAILDGFELLVAGSDLQAMYNMLFPEDQATPRYTHAQLIRLAQAVLGNVQRIALETRPYPAPQGGQANVVEAAFAMLSHHASNQLAQIEHVKPGDTHQLINSVWSAIDALEMRESVIPSNAGVLASPASLDAFSDYELAKTLALSQAIADDGAEQFERDTARAMALSQAGAIQNYTVDDLFDNDPELARILKRKLDD